MFPNESRNQPISARDWLGSKRSIGPEWRVRFVHSWPIALIPFLFPFRGTRSPAESSPLAGEMIRLDGYEGLAIWRRGSGSQPLVGLGRVHTHNRWVYIRKVSDGSEIAAQNPHVHQACPLLRIVKMVKKTMERHGNRRGKSREASTTRSTSIPYSRCR